MLLEEIALAGPEHLDAAYVAAYDRKAGFDPGEDVELLRSLGLGAESTVIDIGAGTGTFALAVAPFCGRVIAADVSPAMVEVLRKHVVPNLEPVHAGFLSYEHTGAPADFVYSRNALHHLPDFWKAIALSRIAALLRPGGILYLRDLVFSYEPAGVEAGIARWLGGAAASGEDGWTREELETHLRDEFSTFTWLLEPMLARAGFAVVAADYAPVGAYAAYTCVSHDAMRAPIASP